MIINSFHFFQTFMMQCLLSHEVKVILKCVPYKDIIINQRCILINYNVNGKIARNQETEYASIFSKLDKILITPFSERNSR